MESLAALVAVILFSSLIGGPTSPAFLTSRDLENSIPRIPRITPTNSG